MKSTRHIVFLIFPEFTLLNLAAPLEIFTSAIAEMDLLSTDTMFEYKIHIVSAEDNEQILSSSQIPITTEGCYSNIAYDIHTLIIAGRSNNQNYNISEDLLLWIKNISAIIPRVCSICEGTFILAKAGVLNGKKATTHWRSDYAFRKEFPKVKLDVSHFYIKDGNIYTSGGITSGMDLALALVKEDLGNEVAYLIARLMILFLKRDGNQIQYSKLLDYQLISHIGIRRACIWIFNNIENNITIEQIADEVNMSPRNFARVFVKEMQITPLKYIERLRVDKACQYLVKNEYTLEQIAIMCGASTTNRLKKMFLKTIGISPIQYIKNFSFA